MPTHSLDELTAGYPENRALPASQVRAAVADSDDEPVFVVLDDDPTGTQSVADLPVLTRWLPDDLDWALAQGKPAIYVMTNSRSLGPEQAKKINVEVAQAALQAAEKRGLPVAFVSRSDSTLRGHFPLEPETLADISEAHGEAVDGIVIVPAFGDAGRVTVGGVHYAGNAEDGFVPVAETEFASDATFGYTHSRLADWVEEKTQGKIPAAQVREITLATVRSDTAKLADELSQAAHRQPIVVDAVTEDDLRRLALGLIVAKKAGKRFLYRVGPPFVRARIGQDVPQPLIPEEAGAPPGHESAGDRPQATGGLIVVGSHVPTTTRQLEQLLAAGGTKRIELDVNQMLGDDSSSYLREVADNLARELDSGNVVLHTSRTLVKGDTPDDSLAIARKVSDAVVDVVQAAVQARRPRFVIAKGGITSSDVASKGLGMNRAMVVGPMQPGIISLWRPLDGRAPGVPYIVFAGNVGDHNSLADVTATLSR